jgi:hypothetical protein
LSLLTARYDRKQSLIPDAQPVVLEIVVTEVKDADKRAEAIQN